MALIQVYLLDDAITVMATGYLKQIEVSVTFAEPAWDPSVSFAKAPKYPNECPCGISARDCEYHQDVTR